MLLESCHKAADFVLSYVTVTLSRLLSHCCSTNAAAVFPLLLLLH